jgi:hypothetical protein
MRTPVRRLPYSVIPNTPSPPRDLRASVHSYGTDRAHRTFRFKAVLVAFMHATE